MSRRISSDRSTPRVWGHGICRCNASRYQPPIFASGRVNLEQSEEVPADLTNAYGIITPGRAGGSLTKVQGLVEKPEPADAPSRLGVIGRYILQPEVMRVLDAQERGAGGEIQLTDAMAKLIGRQPFHGVRFEGDRFDCGDKAGYIAANVAYGLDRPDLAAAIREGLAPYL